MGMGSPVALSDQKTGLFVFSTPISMGAPQYGQFMAFSFFFVTLRLFATHSGQQKNAPSLP
jgi:hypothetical protein